MMPTGYTSHVQDGTAETLKDFTMICARAFGATITMRDDPISKDIPDRFEANTKYHDDRIEEAESLIEELQTLNDVECQNRADAEYKEEIERIKERKNQRSITKGRYESMLQKVKSWEPPENAKNLKQFMIDQLTQSIDFDCYEITDSVKKLTGKEWKEEQKKKALYDLSYHSKERELEIERTKGRNKWLSDLRESLS